MLFIYSLTCAVIGGFFTSALLTNIIVKSKLAKNTVNPLKDFLGAVGSHGSKQVTNLGGLAICASTLITTSIFASLTHTPTIAIMATSFFFFCIGLWDDMSKIITKNSNGSKIRLRLFFTIAATLTFVIVLGKADIIDNSQIVTPSFGHFKNITFLPVAIVVLFKIFTIVGSSNAVNITDGLDGMVSTSMVPTAMLFMVMPLLALSTNSYFDGTEVDADIINLSIYAGALLGSLLGFLWHNASKATIFMGDSGSNFIGCTIGAMAVTMQAEIILAIAGIVFVIETLSTALQIFTIRKFNKRIFKMAPLHHHFEIKGWTEHKIVARSFIVSTLAMFVALMTILK